MNDPVRSELAQAAVDTLTLHVNGRACSVAVEPTTRLSATLRDQLGLTGTKVGCDAGDCGACTVLVDGQQVCACLTAAGQVAGRSVTTIEGLASEGRLHVLQQAFLEHGAAQCGICTPGMLMAAADLLARERSPSEEQVCDALGGVLCRCTGYRKIIDAVIAASVQNLAAVKAVPGAAVGARVVRVDGRAKVTGSEIFGADRYPADALWLRVVRSPHARTRFRLGDLTAFRARHPGIVAVLTAADVPNNAFGVFTNLRDQCVFAQHEARFRGEAVLAIVGAQHDVVAIPESAIPLEWEPLPARESMADALGSAAPPLHVANPDNVLIHGRCVRGDVDAAIAAAAHVAGGEFSTSYVEHAYIEPEAGYAERIGDRVRIFVTTQSPYLDRDEVAHVLGIKPTQVQIVPSACGGGFGGKLDIAIQPLIGLAAWKLGRPVRIVYSRQESMRSTTKRHPAQMRARFACDKQGYLLAADFSGDFNTGAYASWGTTVANRVPVHASGPYHVPTIRALTRAIYTNGPIAGAFRGFGIPQLTIAHEALLDELAERCGLDKLEFRYRNALRPGQPTPAGQRLTASCGLAQCLEALRPRWHAALARCDAFNAAQPHGDGKSGRRRGVGVACMWYGIGNTSIANPSTMRASLRKDGRVMFYNGAVDIGQGSNTTLIQVLADALGLSMDCIDYVMGDTDLTADAGKTSASRQAYVSGNAARRAGEALRKRMLSLVEAADEATLHLDGTTLVATDKAGQKRIDLAELPSERNGDILVGEGTFDPPTSPLDKDGQGVPYSTYAFAAQMAEVEVDLALGVTKVLRIVAAHDVGKGINPTQVEGQIHGGVVQGLGLALMEEYHSGKTENLHDYLIPTFGDVPSIEVLLIEDTEPLGPFGAKGVGEPALIPTAPAIFGAIHHATGVRVRHAPATPDRLRQAILAHTARQPGGAHR